MRDRDIDMAILLVRKDSLLADHQLGLAFWHAVQAAGLAVPGFAVVGYLQAALSAPALQWALGVALVMVLGGEVGPREGAAGSGRKSRSSSRPWKGSSPEANHRMAVSLASETVAALEQYEYDTSLTPLTRFLINRDRRRRGLPPLRASP